jgi:hypothetical protein
MAKLSQGQRVKRLVAVGKLVADKDNWQSALAKATGVSQPMLGFIASGDRVLSARIEEKIARGLIKESKKILKRGVEMNLAAQEILDTLEKKS